MKPISTIITLLILMMAGSIGCAEKTQAPEISDNGNSDPGDLTGTYVIVDTGQEACYNNTNSIACPAGGEPFYGQDSQHDGAQPNYIISDDGLTVYDAITGLTWQKSPDTNGDEVINAADKFTWAGCQAYPSTLNAAEFGGFTNWRLPTIKELFSLIIFTGIDPSGYTGDASSLVPFIDTDYFDFAYGDESAGERLIDSQYASNNLYVDNSGITQLLFGINFADGRIKGYGMMMPGGREKTFLMMCVRDNTSYGINDLIDNNDGTVTDNATGLMWEQDDSGSDVPGGLDWEEALARVAALNTAEHLGYSDWRLPNVKELQSILDYSRSPGTTSSAAIDPMFNATSFTNEAGQADYPFYWSSTTHAHFLGGDAAAYVSFGRAMGYMEGSWVDVHGAGSQRSDPKSGDPADFPFGRGPQGDAIRIYNCVRVVRDSS